MRTIVFQSYAPEPMPAWVKSCLATVEDWARTKNYTYRLLGDELFDPVPADFRERCGSEVLPVTDVARVLWMQRLFAEGFERVVWVDADILVFDPVTFDVDGVTDYALCREIWIQPTKQGRPEVTRNVNNSVLVTTAGSGFVDRYLAEVLQKPSLGALDAGTVVFGAWDKAEALPLITSVASVNHALIHDLVRGVDSFIRAHAVALGHPTGAAHFMHSYSKPVPGRFWIAEANFVKAVDRVHASGGRILNPPLARRL